MGFQIAYLAPELTKKYGLALNVIAGVIYVLSDKGTREIIASEPFLSERTGLSVRMISKAKGILSKEGFLKTRTFNKGLTRVTTLIPTSKLVEVFNLPDHAQHALSTTHNMHDRTSTACVTITHSVRDPSRTECTNDHALHACKNNKENNTGNNIESNSSDAREKNDIAEQSEPTPLKSNPPQAEEKKSSARKERTSFSVPTMHQVVTLIVSWAEDHMAKYPQLKQLDPELEAENFYSYWESRDWKRGSQKIKSLNGTVTTWLINALKYGSIAVKRIPVTNDYRRTGLTREMNQQIANETLDKAGQFADYLKEINGNNSSNQEPLKIGGKK